MADQSFLSGYSTAAIFPNRVVVSRLAGDATTNSGGATSSGRGRRGRVDFFDPVNHRCTLCDVALDCSYSAHASFHEHTASTAIFDRAALLVNSYLAQVLEPDRLRRGAGVPILQRHVPDAQRVRENPAILRDVDFVRAVTAKWWDALQGEAPPSTLRFGRIARLSSHDPVERRWRLRFLLRFLKRTGVLGDSLGSSLHAPASGTFSRTAKFERSEMIGDSIMKNVIPDRLRVLFPLEEGGTSGELSGIQQLLDSNPGLLSIYDYIGLDDVIGARLANSKSKSDVVESLFGDLQSILWSMQSFAGGTPYLCALDRESQYLRALVEHTLHELAHVVIMWRLEKVLLCSRAQLDAVTVESFIQRSQVPGRRPAKEHELDREKYAALPVLTPHARPHAQFPSPGKEQWFFSTHEARTRAGPQQQLLSELAPARSPMPAVLLEHYRAASAPRVTRDKVSYREALDCHYRTAAAAAAAAAAPTADDSGAVEEDEEVPSAADLIRFPSWRRHETLLRVREEAQRALDPLRPAPEELEAVLRKRLSSIAQDEGGVSRRTSASLPDFSARPRPSLSHTSSSQHSPPIHSVTDLVRRSMTVS